MGNRFFKNGIAKGALALAAGALMIAAAVPAIAAGLSNGSGTSGDPTGNFLFTFYDIGTPVGSNTITPVPNFGEPGGDNILRIVAPNGCGNSGVVNAACGNETDVCAMIYAFDDDQEMGECCGCRLTPDQLLTFSVRTELVNNWALATQDNSRGVIVVVGAAINDPGNFLVPGNACGNTSNPTCNEGCSPTVAVDTSSVTNLQASITHDQLINGNNGLTETKLTDQGEGETVNDAYLTAQCAAIAGNATRRNGFCRCDVLPPA